MEIVGANSRGIDISKGGVEGDLALSAFILLFKIN